MATSPIPNSTGKRRRLLPRFTLRTLLVAMGVLGVGLGCIGSYWQRLLQQRRIVAKIEAAGGEVRYEYDFRVQERLDLEEVEIRETSIDKTPDGRKRVTRYKTVGSEKVLVDEYVETPPGPKFLRRLLGDDAFAGVAEVTFFWNFDKIGEFDPQLLLELPQLEIVALKYHQVSDEWLDCVAQVPRLRVLSLTGNDESTASGKGLAALRDAKRLRILGLYGDWVNDDALAKIASLKQLQALHLKETQVTAAMFESVGELTELRELTIFNSLQLDDRGTEQLARLHNLRMLWLNETALTDASLAHLSGLVQLEDLDLKGASIGDAGVHHLAGLANLQQLDISHTHVGDAGLESLVRMRKLRFLDLGSTQVTDAGLPTLARMTQLESLELWPSSITDDGLMQLQTLKNLEHLEIGPHVSKTAADELRQALPNCEIQRVDARGGTIPRL